MDATAKKLLKLLDSDDLELRVAAARVHHPVSTKVEKGRLIVETPIPDPEERLVLQKGGAHHRADHERKTVVVLLLDGVCQEIVGALLLAG